jgi:hypothetical protein
MIDQAALALVDKFDGVFNRDDMVVAATIGLVDNSGQSGRFAAAGRSRYDHQPTGQRR